jgi:hypothetical protein
MINLQTSGFTFCKSNYKNPASAFSWTIILLLTSCNYFFACDHWTMVIGLPHFMVLWSVEAKKSRVITFLSFTFPSHGPACPNQCYIFLSYLILLYDSYIIILFVLWIQVRGKKTATWATSAAKRRPDHSPVRRLPLTCHSQSSPAPPPTPTRAPLTATATCQYVGTLRQHCLASHRLQSWC